MWPADGSRRSRPFGRGGLGGGRARLECAPAAGVGRGPARTPCALWSLPRFGGSEHPVRFGPCRAFGVQDWGLNGSAPPGPPPLGVPPRVHAGGHSGQQAALHHRRPGGSCFVLGGGGLRDTAIRSAQLAAKPGPGEAPSPPKNTPLPPPPRQQISPTSPKKPTAVRPRRLLVLAAQLPPPRPHRRQAQAAVHNQRHLPGAGGAFV
jgi:hypothetical protein